MAYKRREGMQQGKRGRRCAALLEIEFCVRHIAQCLVAINIVCPVLNFDRYVTIDSPVACPLFFYKPLLVNIQYK